MIAVMKFRETFSQSEAPALERSCRQYLEKFPDVQNEFFDTLQSSVPERFFIIRSGTKEREQFVAAVEDFSREMNFEVLKKRESEEVLFRNDLTMFK